MVEISNAEVSSRVLIPVSCQHSNLGTINFSHLNGSYEPGLRDILRSVDILLKKLEMRLGLRFKFLRRMSTERSISRISGSGKAMKTSDLTDRFIVRCIHKNRFVVATQVARKLSFLNLSVDAILGFKKASTVHILIQRYAERCSITALQLFKLL
jgi:hypothetical protein